MEQATLVTDSLQLKTFDGDGDDLAIGFLSSHADGDLFGQGQKHQKGFFPVCDVKGDGGAVSHALFVRGNWIP